MGILKKILYTSLCLLCAISANAGSVKLSVEGSSGRQIRVGDYFYIVYEVSDIDAEPTPPASLPGANVSYFTLTSHSSSYQIVGNTKSGSVKYRYTLTAHATKEGKYTFGPVKVGGAISNKVSYTIVDKGAPEQTGNSNTASGPKFIGKGDGNLFLKADISKTTAYEQEALVYTIKLYTTYAAVKFVGATAAPKFEGFVVEESKETSNQFSYEKYQGKMYATLVIARYIIFPQMTGNLKVKGNTYTISVDQREYYQDPFLSGLSVSSPLQLNVNPNDLVVNVKALPEPKPNDFSGGVGNFTIQSQLLTPQIRTNQAATIIYTIKGVGNLKYIKLPELNTIYPPQLEVYTPNSKVDVAVGVSNVQGQVRFECSFMPLAEGEFSIPPLKLVFFNPQTGKYETATAQGFNIKVGKGNASANSQKSHKLAFHSQLLPVKENLSPDHSLLVNKFGYWSFYILPFIALVTSVIFYRRYINLNSDLVALRSRRAAKEARKRLKKAELCLKKNLTSQFFDEILIAIWGYLSDKLKISTSELTRDNIASKLQEAGVTEPVIKDIVNLIDECEFAKYAPNNDVSESRQVYNRATNLINSIDQVTKQKQTSNAK